MYEVQAARFAFLSRWSDALKAINKAIELNPTVSEDFSIIVTSLF